MIEIWKEKHKNDAIDFSEFITAAMEHALQLSECNIQLAFDSLSNDEGLIDAEALKKAFGDTRDEDDNKFDTEDEIWEMLILHQPRVVI